MDTFTSEFDIRDMEVEVMSKNYDQELKEKVVKEVKETGALVAVARRHGIASSTVSIWVKAAGGSSSNNMIYSNSKREENKKLLAENQRLKNLIGEHALKISILEDLVKKTNHRKMIDSQLPGIG